MPLRMQQEKVSANAATRQAESLSKDDAILRAKNRRKQLEKEFEIEKPEIKILLGAFIGIGRLRTGFPNYSTNGMSNPRVVAKVKRASELLNKYGDLFLQKKLIAP